MVMRSRNVRRKSIKRKNNKRRRVSKRIKSSRRKSTKKRRVSRRIKRTRNRKISKKRISQKYIRGGNGKEAAGITKPKVGDLLASSSDEDEEEGGEEGVKKMVEHAGGGPKRDDEQDLSSSRQLDNELADLLASSSDEEEARTEAEAARVGHAFDPELASLQESSDKDWRSVPKFTEKPPPNTKVYYKDRSGKLLAATVTDDLNWVSSYKEAHVEIKLDEMPETHIIVIWRDLIRRNN